MPVAIVNNVNIANNVQFSTKIYQTRKQTGKCSPYSGKKKKAVEKNTDSE